MVTADEACERYRGLLAEEALLGLDPAAHAELQGHLAGCAACRAEAADLARTAGALAWVDPAAAEELARHGATAVDPSPTVALDAAVAGILASDAGARPTGPGPGAARRPGRRARVLVPLLTAAAVVLLVGAIGLTHTDHPETRTVTLSGPGGVHATAVLTAESWGTSVTLTQPAARWGQVLTVSMATDYGRPWNAGSYWAATSHGVTVTLACALPVDRIRTIAVTGAGGGVVLAGRQGAPPTGG